MGLVGYKRDHYNSSMIRIEERFELLKSSLQSYRYKSANKHVAELKKYMESLERVLNVETKEEKKKKI